jgi:hypothetical protein
MNDINLNNLNLKPFKVRPNFYYGFEFEGLIHRSHYDDFKFWLRDLNSEIRFGSDSSIHSVPYNFYAIEFKTPKLSEKIAFPLLEDILCYLYILSQADIFKTNSTCGFHVNMSENNVLVRHKQLEFYSNIVSDFDEDKMLKLFNRERSTYCRPFKKANRCKSVEAILKRIKHLDSIQDSIEYYHRIRENKKYYCVALREHPGYYDRKNERIEFRAIGNKDYHLRFNDLTTSINHILEVTKKSFKNTINTNV